MGTWSTLTAPTPPAGSTVGADIALLLTDGSVLMHNGSGSNTDEWYRLTPGDDGKYASGSWSSALKMTYTRLYFASGVLRDGRVFAIGGEYSNDPNDLNPGAPNTFAPSAEVFDPDTNTWRLLTAGEKPATVNQVAGDAPACVLADGRVLVGEPLSANCWLWDPDDMSWIPAGTRFGAAGNTKQCSSNDEETWALLPDGSVLTVTITPTTTRATQRYVPAQDAWVSAGQTPQSLVLATVRGVPVTEIGPGLTLPSGRAFFVGGNGQTALYTPPTVASPNGIWASGPTTPATAGATPISTNLTDADGPGVLMPNGRVIFLAGTTTVATTDAAGNPTGYFSMNPRAFEYNPATSPQPATMPQLAAQPTLPNNSWTYEYWMLLLPTGQLLLTHQTAGAPQLYTPNAGDGSPQAGWKPRITAAPSAVVRGHTFTLSGTQFNGLSQACSYGDDGQMATNYPIVRVTHATTGKVRYLKTHHHSTMGIATGAATVSTDVDVPDNLPTGSYQLVVIANGIASDPATVRVGAQDCFFRVDNSTFSQGQVDTWLRQTPPVNAVFDPALQVVVEGYTPAEIGLDTSRPIAPQLAGPPRVPTVTGLPAGMSIALSTDFPLQPEDMTLPNRPQRFAFNFKITFANDSMFGTTDRTVTLHGSFTGAGVPTVTNDGVIALTKKPNPFILHGDQTQNPPAPWYLSVDLRVFQIRAAGSKFETTLGASPTGFIQAVLANLNGDVGNSRTAFANLPQTEDAAVLQLSPTTPDGTAVYNFALARVHYRDISQVASKVRVFFRTWQAQQTAAVYDRNTTYRRLMNTHNEPIPVLGVSGDEIISIPYYAEPRVATNQAMSAQRDTHNVLDIPMSGTGSENVRFFGCWLDINQTTPRYPQRIIGVSADGPFNTVSPLLSIQQLMRAAHQCLIAEIAFDPDPIQSTATPDNSDKLAQRNLAFVGAPNPGVLASRRVPQTFELRPTGIKHFVPDELVIEWGATPGGADAEIYLPAASADDILAVADELYYTHRLAKVDAHTLRCPVGGVTYVPVPEGTDPSLPGLLTVGLPDGIRKGEHFDVVVRQMTAIVGREPGRNNEEPVHPFLWRRTTGVFRLAIPVGTKESLIGDEVRLLGILRWIGNSIHPTSRWRKVFDRYLDQVADRVKFMGGDPDSVKPSPDGEGKGQRPWGEHAAVTGKIRGITFDHFGDFSGFTLDTEDEVQHRFSSHEQPVREVVERAWRDRQLVTVVYDRDEPHLFDEIIVLG